MPTAQVTIPGRDTSGKLLIQPSDNEHPRNDLDEAIDAGAIREIDYVMRAIVQYRADIDPIAAGCLVFLMRPDLRRAIHDSPINLETLGGCPRDSKDPAYRIFWSAHEYMVDCDFEWPEALLEVAFFRSDLSEALRAKYGELMDDLYAIRGIPEYYREQYLEARP